MNISCCAWTLSDPETHSLKQIAELDFAHLDVQTHTYATAQSQTNMDALKMRVCCVGLSFNMPDGAALDSPSADARQRAIAHIEQGLDQAAQSGANTAYVVPEGSKSARPLRRKHAASADLAAERNFATSSTFPASPSPPQSAR